MTVCRYGLRGPREIEDFVEWKLIIRRREKK